MSAYPPPQPPPPPQAAQPSPTAGPPNYGQIPPPGYGPKYWQDQRKAQERLLRAQLRMQRDQLRAQARAARRTSILGPLFLLFLGIVFLLIETGRVSWSHALLWYGRWWPLLLIAAGLVMLLEWALNGRRGAVLGGGMVALLILLGIAGWSAGVVRTHAHWNGDANGFTWNPFWGETHVEDGAPLSAAISSTGTLQIHNPDGGVSVTGSSDDGEVHVTAHKEIRSSSDAELNNDRRSLQPYFSGTPAAAELSVGQADNSHVDLQVTVPRGVTLLVDNNHGLVSVSEMHAPVSLSVRNGDVNVSGITGPLTAHLNSSEDTFSARSVTGSVALDGRSGDINLSDITGAVSLQGRFAGTTHVERVYGTVVFETYRTQFHAARVDGQLDISSGESDAPLQGEAILGPVLLHTKDRVITLDRVQGNVDLVNSNGAVSVTAAGPLGTLAVQNQDASVTLGLPANSGFSLNAQTHNGHLTNDFGLVPSGNEDRSMLTGTVVHGGPMVSVSTSDGDVTLRKISEQALPATVAPPPVLTQPAEAGSLALSGASKASRASRSASHKPVGSPD